MMTAQSLIAFGFGFISGTMVGAVAVAVSYLLGKNGTATMSSPSQTAANIESLTSNPYYNPTIAQKQQAIWPQNLGHIESERSTSD